MLHLGDEGNSQIKEPANVNKSGSTPNSNSNGAGIASKSETSGIEASNGICFEFNYLL